MTKYLWIAIVLLALSSASLGRYARRQHLRADQAEQSLALSEQGSKKLWKELKAQTAAVDALRKAGETQARQVAEAGVSAGRARRAGEVQVQRILMTVAPQDPGELAAWGAAQAQDLNRRLEAAP